MSVSLVGARMATGATTAWKDSFRAWNHGSTSAAVNSSFLLFFPFLFLTSSYVPRSQLSGWLDTVAGLNPVTYLLDGMRSLVVGEGWQWAELAQAAVAIGAVAAVSMSPCFA
ncbi:MAG: ABC transporter permease, partial [Aldersonia sp.]|nr:ABC transporter permease [Aldersonia sp.]